MVPLGWLNEVGEASGMLSPIELTTVDDDTTDRGTVATNPFGGTFYDNVGTMVERAKEITTSTKGIINLESNIGQNSYQLGQVGYIKCL